MNKETDTQWQRKKMRGIYEKVRSSIERFISEHISNTKEDRENKKNKNKIEMA